MPRSERHGVVRLPSGARVVTAPMRERASVTVAIMVGAGSRYESRSECGVAHFLEHMVFKGSERYPTARAISEAVESVGGVLNAATDKEMTMFWAKVPSQHVGLAVDVLADMVFRCALDPEEIVRERQVVVEELRMYADNPQEHVGTVVEEVLWPDHPLGWDTAGTEESVQELTRESCVDFLGRHYLAGRVVAAVAGTVDVDAVTARLADRLGSWGEGEAPVFLPAVPLAGGERVRLQRRRTEQANVCIGARSASYTDDDRYAIDLLTAVLGEGMSSRLFLSLREEQGLAYDVHAYTVKHRDSGALIMGLGCEPKRAPEAMSAAIEELSRLATEPIGEAELLKARAMTVGRLALQLEGTSSLCTFLGQQELLTDEILMPDELVKRVEAVTPDDLRRLAAGILDAGLRGAVIGPFASATRFERVLART